MQNATGVAPELIPGGGGIFDVHVDGDLVFSKFAAGGFPDEAGLVAKIQVR